MTCEGCRALHDDKHDAYEIRWWQITSERGIMTQCSVKGLTGQCVLHPTEAYRLSFAASQLDDTAK